MLYAKAFAYWPSTGIIDLVSNTVNQMVNYRAAKYAAQTCGPCNLPDSGMVLPVQLV